jgi:hypothetical protein
MSGRATPNVLRIAIHGMIFDFSKRTSVFQKINGEPPELEGHGAGSQALEQGPHCYVRPRLGPPHRPGGLHHLATSIEEVFSSSGCEGALLTAVADDEMVGLGGAEAGLAPALICARRRRISGTFAVLRDLFLCH